MHRGAESLEGTRWILIVEASDEARRLFTDILEPFGRVCHASDPEALATLLHAHGPPSVALINPCGLADSAGIEMARHLRRDHETPVLFVTRPGNSRMGHVALRLGASHLPWSSGDDVLALLAYLFLLPGEIETRVVPSIPAVHDLTPKESKLFRLRMDGTPREELVTSESRNTIRNQVRSVSKKLGDRSYASWPDIVGEHARRLRGNLIDEAPTDHLENRSARPGLGKARASRDSGVRRRHVADAKPEDGAAPGIRRVRRARRRR